MRLSNKRKTFVSCACAWISSDGGELDLGKETEKTLVYLQNLREMVYSESH